jgi:hypothetical protein
MTKTRFTTTPLKMADNEGFQEETQQNREERRQIRLRYRNLIDELQGICKNIFTSYNLYCSFCHMILDNSIISDHHLNTVKHFANLQLLVSFSQVCVCS